MKFGPVPVVQAEGAILAHSVAVGQGRIRKGIVLQARDIAALRAAGITDVTVALLGPDDIDEDRAAEAIAHALIAPGAAVRTTTAATGRVNLIAETPGIAAVDEDALLAVNRIDPMITVATVPSWQRMEAGGLIATIKIISYGVEKTLVTRAKAVADAAIGLLVPVVRDVGLIETSIGTKLSDKGEVALVDRLVRLGVRFSGRLEVTHQVDSLAAALRASTAEVVCILTGSATSDLKDTAPQALRAAGGVVHRFGMPVDPGNLLFLGELHGRPVIGLPGCARSPALNGADWVLERVLCGVSVTSDDIAAMGVGGLLKEIPSRPRPRQA